MPPKYVLIVDDDDAVRDALKDVLEDEGHRVATAVNGADALAQLRGGERPDLVLVDHMMPVMDGPTFVARVVQDPGLQSLRLVLVTADGRAPAKASAMGLRDYLPKPVALDDLLRLLDIG